MSAPGGDRVYVREELVYFDGSAIHVAGGKRHELELADQVLLDRVYRGEGDVGLLARNIAEGSVGASADDVRQRLEVVFSDPRSLLELGPAPPTSVPDVIVCDFTAHSTPIDGRTLVRNLRKRHRVLFLGLEAKVASTSRDTHWFRTKAPAGHPENWFRFIQWARSTIRLHADAVLVLLGHQDAILLGDLAARHPTVVVLDPSWPSGTGLEDLRGRKPWSDDVGPSLRALHYALRFTPLRELQSLNRHSSSALAELEIHALRHARHVLFSQADQVGALMDLGVPRSRLAPACLPAPSRRDVASGERILLVVADLEFGLGPVMPFLSLLARLPEAPRSHDRIVLYSGGQAFEVRIDGETARVSPTDLRRARDNCVIAFLLPSVLRSLGAAVESIASGVPIQIVPSTSPHPLQQDADECLFLRAPTAESVHARLVQLLDGSARERKRVLAAQHELVTDWSVRRRIADAVRHRIPRDGAGHRDREGHDDPPAVLREAAVS